MSEGGKESSHDNQERRGLFLDEVELNHDHLEVDDDGIAIEENDYVDDGISDDEGEELFDRPCDEIQCGLWADALEVWVHQILYVRRLYPNTQASYSSSRFSSCQVKLCQHPQVVKYIRNVIHQVVIPTIILDEVVDSVSKVVEVVVELYDPRRKIVYEQYFLAVSIDKARTASRTCPDLVESELRDLVCSGVGKLEGMSQHPSLKTSGSVSFRILVRQGAAAEPKKTMNDEIEKHRQSTEEIMNVSLRNAMTAGKWCRARSSSKSTPPACQPGRRIVFSSPGIGCQFWCRRLATPSSTTTPTFAPANEPSTNHNDKPKKKVRIMEPQI